MSKVKLNNVLLLHVVLLPSVSFWSRAGLESESVCEHTCPLWWQNELPRGTFCKESNSSRPNLGLRKGRAGDQKATGCSCQRSRRKSGEQTATFPAPGSRQITLSSSQVKLRSWMTEHLLGLVFWLSPYGTVPKWGPAHCSSYQQRVFKLRVW